MDIKQYIESGILELYVLGRLSGREAGEVEEYADEHPEVREEITHIEKVLEQLAVTMAVPVEARVLQKALQQIRSEQQAPATVPTEGARSLAWVAWALALLALAAAAWFWSVSNGSQSELQEVRQELETLRADCATISSERENTQSILAGLTLPDTRSIVLNGTENAPDKRAVVFYNTATEATYFSPSNLPAPPAGKQYQLWGIDGDGPKSLGVLDLDLDDGAILNLDYLPGVAAFAITLEDLGGKDAPDLSQLQVIGEV